MSFNSRLKKTQKALGVTGVSGAAPQTVNGNAVNMQRIQQGTLSANVYAKATINTLTLTGKWQVSDDNSTWRDAYLSNRPANVVIVTGTGSAVSDNIVVSAPDTCYGKSWARFVITSGTASGSGAGSDECNISYNWLESALV